MVHGHVQMMALSSLMMDSHRFFHCVGSTPIMRPNFTQFPLARPLTLTDKLPSVPFSIPLNLRKGYMTVCCP